MALRDWDPMQQQRDLLNLATRGAGITIYAGTVNITVQAAEEEETPVPGVPRLKNVLDDMPEGMREEIAEMNEQTARFIRSAMEEGS